MVRMYSCLMETLDRFKHWWPEALLSQCLCPSWSINGTGSGEFNAGGNPLRWNTITEIMKYFLT